MSTNPQLNASNYILNIVELQNVVTAASGLTPLDVLTNTVTNIQEMVNFDLKRINVNSISNYNQTPIQIFNDLNLCNSALYSNGILYNTGGGGSAFVTAGSTNITVANATTSNATVIGFNINGSNILSFQSNTNVTFQGSNFILSSVATLQIQSNAGAGRSFVCLNSAGDGTWGYPSTLATADSIRFLGGSGAELARFTNTGRFGVGTTNPAVAVDVVGEGYFTGRVSAFDFLTLSDRRFKTNVHAIEKPIQILSSIQGVRFTWRDLSSEDIGFLAQDLQKVVPEAVVGKEESTAKMSVAYHKIIPILVESIKELQARVLKLEEVLASR
jgi:hypothetical protein